MKPLKYLRTTVLVALCALAFNPMSLLAGNANKTAKAAEKRGVIKSVDAAAHHVTITDQKTKAVHSYSWNDKTKFTEQDKAVGASALREGQKVSVSYSTGAGTPVLKHVKLLPAKSSTKGSSSGHSKKKTPPPTTATSPKT